MNEAAFLEAILANPDEDASRLVFADWLEEHGHSDRAEFIRLQIRLSQTAEHDRFYQEMYYGRRKDFYGGTFKSTLPALPEGFQWPTLETFRRGFAWGVETTDITLFLRHAPDVFSRAPLQHLVLDGRAEGFAEQIPLLADSPWLSQLRSLEIKLARLGAEPIRHLCESPYAQQLQRLALPFAGIDRSGVEALVHSSLFPRLNEVSLESTDYGAPVGPTMAATLARISAPCRLQRLNLAMTRFGPSDAQLLAASSALASLTHLNLNRCSYDSVFREAGYRALSESPYLSHVEMLDLAQTAPQLEGIRALATSATWKNLRALNLGDNRLGPKAGQMIASAPFLENLTMLELHGNKVGDKTAVSIAQSPQLTHLAVLDLRGTNISDMGARALLDSPNLSSLVHLDLGGNSLSDRMKSAFQERFAQCVFV